MKVREGGGQAQHQVAPVTCHSLLQAVDLLVRMRKKGAGTGCGAALTPFSPQEALQCVQELGSPSSLYIFVQNGIESTLERSTISREHMGVLLCQLVKAGTLSKEQYYKG